MKREQCDRCKGWIDNPTGLGQCNCHLSGEKPIIIVRSGHFEAYTNYGGYVASDDFFLCGHKHRSEEAAERCLCPRLKDSSVHHGAVVWIEDPEK